MSSISLYRSQYERIRKIIFVSRSVFLDIEMPGGSGFDLLSKVDKQNFLVIFVTASDKYAIKAFKFSAIAYLLKPVDEEELIRTVSEAEKHKKENSFPSIEALNKNYNTLRSDIGKLGLTKQTGLVFVEKILSDVRQIENTPMFTLQIILK